MYSGNSLQVASLFSKLRHLCDLMMYAYDYLELKRQSQMSYSFWSKPCIIIMNIAVIAEPTYDLASENAKKERYKAPWNAS